VLALQADCADPAAVTTAVDRAPEVFGRLDILVNNAGIGFPGAVEDFSFEDFDRMVAVNVKGVFAAVMAALPRLGQGGRIISTGSINADRVPVPGISVYAMTKAAVAGLTRGPAREPVPRGITINNVQVGPTDTDMTPDDHGRSCRAASRNRKPDVPQPRRARAGSAELRSAVPSGSAVLPVHRDQPGPEPGRRRRRPGG
jgi:3-oxoacyl-[acyl-carrier protein] reductase